MQLRKITLHRYEAPLKKPFVTALRRVDKLESRIVRIETASGVVGLGEVVPTPPITQETFETIQEGFERIRQALMQARDGTFETMLTIIGKSDAKTPTKAAFESALFGIASQQAGQPLWRFLQDYFDAHPPTMQGRTLQSDITISVGDVAATLRDAEDAVARGYRHLKVKLDGDVTLGIERIRALHRRFPKIALRLDANQAFDVQGCVHLLQTLENDGIVCECIEQPLPADAIEGMAYVKAHTQTPMLADESVFSYDQAEAIITADAADMLNIKLAKTGGLREAARIAMLCKKHAMPAMMGCMLEGPVAIATAAHFALAFCDTVRLVDLDAVDLLDDPPYDGDVVFEGARIVLPS